MIFKAAVAEARLEQARKIRAWFHAAAHGFAAARLGLPVARLSLEGVTYAEGAVEEAMDCLPIAEARDELERYAVVAAAGLVSEIMMVACLDVDRYRQDQREVVRYATALGIGETKEEPAVDQFLRAVYDQALAILLGSPEAPMSDAWQALARRLMKRGELSGDLLASIVAKAN